MSCKKGVAGLSLGLALAAILASGSSMAACASTDSAGSTGSSEAGGGESGLDATPSEDSSLPEPDASKDAGLDSPRDAAGRDANGPGALDGICSFNWDCQSALRCECTEATGCACKAGPRGTGRNGIDPCVSGNGCASAVCVEGPPDAGFFCSDECGTSAECPSKLPVCTTISFVGRICVRAP